MTDLAHYKGVYYCDRNGVIYSKYTGNYKVIKPFLTKGYKRVTIIINGERKHTLVHRIIGSVFLDDPNDSPAIINHKDGNKQNNNVTNLEWCSHSYNLLHSYSKLNRTLANAKLTSTQVANIRTDYKQGVNNQKQLAEKYNVADCTISEIVNCKRYKYI